MKEDTADQIWLPSISVRYLLHSHKKRKDSLEARAVYIEIPWVSLEIYRTAQNTGDRY